MAPNKSPDFSDPPSCQVRKQTNDSALGVGRIIRENAGSIQMLSFIILPFSPVASVYPSIKARSESDPL